MMKIPRATRLWAARMDGLYVRWCKRDVTKTRGEILGRTTSMGRVDESRNIDRVSGWLKSYLYFDLQRISHGLLQKGEKGETKR